MGNMLIYTSLNSGTSHTLYSTRFATPTMAGEQDDAGSSSSITATQAPALHRPMLFLSHNRDLGPHRLSDAL